MSATGWITLAVLTFWIWGIVPIMLTYRSRSRRYTPIIVGSISVWMINVILFDLCAAFVLFIEGLQGKTITSSLVLQHLDWFWSWGQWIVLALALSNAVAVVGCWTRKWHIRSEIDIIAFTYYAIVILAILVAFIAAAFWVIATIVTAVGVSPS